MKSFDIHRYPVRLKKLTLLVAAVVVLASGYGAGYGSDEIFLNRGDDSDGWGQASVVTTTSATLVDENTVDAGGHITWNYPDTLFPSWSNGLVWSTSPKPKLRTNEEGSTDENTLWNAPFTSQMTHLAENTHYYFRAYATYNEDTVYGEQKTFITGSTAGGGTWVWTEQDAPNREWYGVASSADGTKLVAVVEDGYIFTSTDSGENWTARKDDDERRWKGVASSSDGTKLVAVNGGSHHGKIYTSTDSGENWTARYENEEWRAVASSSDGTKLVAVVNDGYIYTSSDSGENWKARKADKERNWQGVASSSDGTKLVAVEWDGYIYTSSDSGVTWKARGENKHWRGVASSADGTKLVAVADGDYIYTSADSGVAWTNRGVEKVWVAVASSSDGTKLVAVTYADYEEGDDNYIYTGWLEP